MINKELVDKIVSWISDYIKTSNSYGIVVGISGGKDSLVVAKLCVLAVGNENVFGVIMPNGQMTDRDDAINTCKILGIPYSIVDISQSYNQILDVVKKVNFGSVSEISKLNTAPRIRMTTLYAIAGSMNYLVANTSNLSESMIGYCTKWGDNVGDFAPIINFTKTEVCKIGHLLNLPQNLVEKLPSDGLTGKTDEENFGFGYDELDEFIRTGNVHSNFESILKRHNSSKHKRKAIHSFEYKSPNHFDDML